MSSIIIFSIILISFIVFSKAGNAGPFGGSLDSGLVSHWNFDAANGSSPTAAVDVVGSNDGNVVGGATQVSSCVKGEAYDFDGVDDYINCGNDASLPSSGVVTVSAWVKFTDIQNSGIVGRFVKQDARIGGDTYIVSLAGNDLAIFTDNGDIEIRGDCTANEVFCPSSGLGILEVKSGAGATVASVDSNGNLCLVGGDCISDASCSVGGLTITDGVNTVMSISDSGNLCFTGNLIERGLS